MFDTEPYSSGSSRSTRLNFGWDPAITSLGTVSALLKTTPYLTIGHLPSLSTAELWPNVYVLSVCSLRLMLGLCGGKIWVIGALLNDEAGKSSA